MYRKTNTTVSMDKWCRYIVLAGHVAAALLVLGHILWYFAARSVLAWPPDVYLRNYIVLPAVVFFLLNGAVHLLVFGTRIPLEVKEQLCLSLFVSYAFYLSLTHDITRVLLAAYVLPIFASTVFANVKLTRRIFTMSMVVVWLPALRWNHMGILNSDLIMDILVSSFLFIATFCVARVSILYGRDNLAAINESREEALRNELAFLQAQIKPHFLFNSISTIISFCYTDGERAAELLTHLVKYMRLVIDIDQATGLIPLEREIELIEHYVMIEQARFGEKVRMEYEIDPDLLDLMLPSFAIQPLVENAIKHGILPKDDGGTVKLSIQKAKDFLEIRVSDTGVGFPAELVDQLKQADFSHGGVGLFNVYRRIMSWQAADINIESRDGTGTLISIKVPAVFE